MGISIYIRMSVYTYIRIYNELKFKDHHKNKCNSKQAKS